MAPPANGSVKTRRPGPGHSRQPSKPVVPAIPLPHVKRQAAVAAAAAAAASTTDNSSSVSSSDAPRPSEKPGPNGSSTAAKPRAPVVVSSGRQPARARAPTDAQSSTLPDPNTTAGDDAATLEATPTAIHSSAAEAEASGAVQGPASTVTVTVEPKTLEKQALAASSETPVLVNGTQGKNQPKQKLAGDHSTAGVARPRPPPAVSPTRYQMPRPFHPAGRSANMMANGDMHRGVKPGMVNGPPHMHQAHPSNGSVHFGAFHGSASSSPAPPHSGGIAPPPGMPLPDGRQPYMPLANGYPPMPPYVGDMMPGGPFDTYGRPAMYPPIDAYPPAANNFGPSTPHSFHDSQSSAQPEENGMYGPYPLGPPRNGMGAPIEDMQMPSHQGRGFGAPDYPRMMPNHGVPPHMMPQADDADDMIGYLQQQFGLPDFADCTLELRYLDDRAPPVRIPGHQVLLCRSPHVYQIMRKQGFQPAPSDRLMQTILLETASKWVRSDSFYMAVQRLYGLPLLPIPPPRNNPDAEEVMSAGNFGERFAFSLSYAAAGHILGWAPVVRRGCEVATHVLDWQTVEAALDFALEEYEDKGSHEVFKYGDGSRILLGAVVTFVVHNFPYNFTLDPSLQDPKSYRRLPPHPAPPVSAVQPPLDSDMPSIAQGSSVQFGNGRRSQKLDGIRFGDLSLSEQPKNGNTSHGGPKQEQPLSHIILSRLLLNLPFTQLKMILESAGSGNVNGWANAEVRYRIIKDAVAQRESRRLRALEAVTSGLVPDAELILRHLRSPEPQFLDQWSTLGWQEEILPYGNPDGPALGRKWVPLAEPQRAVSEYP